MRNINGDVKRSKRLAAKTRQYLIIMNVSHFGSNAYNATNYKKNMIVRGLHSFSHKTKPTTSQSIVANLCI